LVQVVALCQEKKKRKQTEKEKKRKKRRKQKQKTVGRLGDMKICDFWMRDCVFQATLNLMVWLMMPLNFKGLTNFLAEVIFQNLS